MCLITKTRLDSETETLIPIAGGGFDVAQPIPYDLYQITAPVNRQNRKPGDPCHTLARDNAAHAAVAIQGTLIGRGENAGPQGSGADDTGTMFTLTKTDVHAVAIQDVRAVEKAQNGKGWNDDGTAYTVDTHATQGVAVAFGVGEQPDVGHCLRSGASKADKHESTTYVAQPITFGAQMSVPQTDVDMVQTLQAKNPMAVAQPVAFDAYNHTISGDCAGSLTTTGGPPLSGPGVLQPIGLDEEQNARVDGFGTLKARMEGGGFEGTVMTTAMQVRRLLPEECEKLQGFLPGYTNIPWRGKPESPDGPRYKALGNSMAVPVMRWIGERINEVEAL